MDFSLKNVLVLGSNPSTSSPDNSAFHSDTKSRRTLDIWFSNIFANFYYENLYPFKTPNNKQLTISQISYRKYYILEKAHEADYVIAVGSIVSKFLKREGVKHFSLFHPSGLNRKLNDPNQLVLHLTLLEKFLQT